LKLPVILLLLTCCAGLAGQTWFSPTQREETFALAMVADTLQLAARNILRESETITLLAPADTLLLRRDADYRLDCRAGRLTILRIPDGYTHLRISYGIYPQGLTSRFSYFTQVADTTQTAPAASERKTAWGSSTRLNISGSKSISVSVGSEEDVTLNQSLFVQMNGELGANVFVEAQLSDSYSPITAEGDSRELSSLDQVFIRLYGDPYEIAFGDLDFPFQSTAFMDWNPQYNGLRAGWFRGAETRGALAVSEAQATTVEFDGDEATQGPYYLLIDEDNVQVVAGSETIYLDGAVMDRGTDYTIDYSAGSITFTEKHFISENSHIMAVFQYSDEEYRKNLYLWESTVPWGDHLSLGLRMAVQNDDRDNPLDGDLSDEDKALLRAAGDSEVWGDGAVEADEGEGNYILVGIGNDAHYEYVGYDSTGAYTVTFAYVGYGLGDYEPLTTTTYYWVGVGQGSYLPLRQLSAPEARANYDVSAVWEEDAWSLSAEAMLSHHDMNTFSDLDDDDNDRLAWQTQGAWHPDWDNLRPSLNLRYRELGSNLYTFAELADPVDSYDLSGFASMDSLRRREMSGSFYLTLWDALTPGISAESRDAGDTAQYDRLTGTLNCKQTAWSPTVSVTASRAEQDWRGDNPTHYKNRLLNVQSYYTRWQGQLGGSWKRNESRAEHEADSTGTRLITRETWLKTVDTRRWAGKLSLKDERNETLADAWNEARYSWTASGEGTLNTDKHDVQTQYAHREVNTAGAAGRQRYDMAGLNVQSRPWGEGLVLGVDYSLQNTAYYPKVRELVWVGEEEGQYDSTGVYDTDGEYDFEYVNTGESELSIEVDAEFNVSAYPRLLLPQGSTSPLTRLQSETNLVVMENSRSGSGWKVYVLSPSALMDDDTTIYGRQSGRQTFWYELVKRKLTAKVSGEFARTLDQRYQDADRTRERSLETSLSWQGLGMHDLEMTYKRRFEEDSHYDSDINSHAVEAEVVSRPSGQWTLQTGADWLHEYAAHTGTEEDYTLTSLGGSEYVTWFWQTRTRVFGKVAYHRIQRGGSSYLTSLAGKREGDQFTWSLSLSYSLNPYTQLTGEYTGESYPQEKAAHKMQVEIKAEF